MSLEATIAENTAALRDLITTIKAGVPTTATQVAAVVAQASPEAQADAAEKPTASPKAAAKSNPDAVAASTPRPPTAADADATAAPTYQDAATAVTDLAKTKGRDTAVAVLSKFGAAKLPDVKPEQFAAVIAACQEAAEA